MTTLDAEAVRRAMINCSKGDTKRMNLTDGVVGTDLDTVEYVAWHDPRIPQQAYLVAVHEGALVGVLLRRAAGGARRTAMCALCRTTHSGGNVSLFTAPRTGAAGRQGNTIGTYICDDLACPRNARLERAPHLGMTPELGRPVAERVAGLRTRLDVFLSSIQQGD